MDDSTDDSAATPKPVRKPAAPRTTTPRKPAAKSTTAGASAAAPKPSAAKASSAVKKPAAPKATAPGPAAAKLSSTKAAAPKPAATKPAATKPAAPKTATPKTATPKTAATKPATPKSVATPKAVAETPVVEIPAAETPVVEPPIAKTPVVDTPDVETPIVEATAEETLAPDATLPHAGPSLLSMASDWSKRAATASNSRVTELRNSLAAARDARATRVAAAIALAGLRKTTQDPDVETSDSGFAGQKTTAKAAPPAKTVATLPKTSTELVAHSVMLTVTGLTKRFDETVAVAGIDLEVRVGDFYGIVGPNGAGKTTTLSMITGLLRPDAGTVTVHGTDVWSDPLAAKRYMGVLPDRLRLFDRLTGWQLLYYAGILRGLDAAVVRKRSADLAQAFGLEESMGRLVTDYSAGMTKKIALAAAMIHSPRMLVLDEPFESVDPVSAATVTDILKKYAAAGGTVVLSSHSMDMVQRICDHVAVVVDGQILADGTIDEVRAGKSLEERFVELTGGLEVAEGLPWLHSFST